MKKLLLLLLLLPGVAPASTTARVKKVVYEKMAVPTSNSQYPDSLITSEVRQATFDVSTISHCSQATRKIGLASGTFRVAIADSGLKILSVYKRKDATSTTSFQGVPEVTQDKFGFLQTGASVFNQSFSGDTLVMTVQPTSLGTGTDTFFVTYSFFQKSYVDTAADATENPLPQKYEGLVPVLAALRLLSRESPYRDDVITRLYNEFLAIGTALRIEGISDLYILPNYIRAAEEAKPK